MLIDRRAMVTRLGSLIVGAPAIVRASSLMPVKLVDWPPNEHRHAGWIDRLAYQMMGQHIESGLDA
jgi:hypothetical protein